MKAFQASEAAQALVGRAVLAGQIEIEPGLGRKEFRDLGVRRAIGAGQVYVENGDWVGHGRLIIV